MTEVTIDLHDEFISEIDSFVKTSDMGYENREEFFREAVRVHHKKMKED